jgi:hypothetical protein
MRHISRYLKPESVIAFTRNRRHGTIRREAFLRVADVSSECVGGHKGACRYEFGDEKGRGRIRNGSSAGCLTVTLRVSHLFHQAKLHSAVVTGGVPLSMKV